MQQTSSLKKTVDEYDVIDKKFKDVLGLIDLAEAEGDESMEGEISQETDKFLKELDDAEFKVMLSEDDDKRDAIITINSGAGGTEAQDWAEMLLRM